MSFELRSLNLYFKLIMILFFHFICLLARYIFSNISKSLIKGKQYSNKDEDDFIKSKSYHFSECKIDCTKYPVYEDDTLKFFPPVFVQRYETVALILQEYAVKGKMRKVVDFGCAELGFFMYLKNVKDVNEILEVDIDEDILERYSFKAAPLMSDYLMRKGSKHLDVYILAGSIADYDDRLMGCDVVIAIELIEHLCEDAFERMPYNVFYKIKPKLAIFTTPNADFNSLLPNFEGVRNKDHKFEWSRKEFYNWTQNILKLYPEYSVKFYGIGGGPEGTENLGCCSQMAVFQKCDDDDEFFSTARKESVNIHNYKLIKHYEYPYYTDTRTIEEKIVHEIQYHAAHFITLDTYYNFDCCESEIPLSLLKEYVSDLCSSDEELITILKKNGMILRKNNNAWYLVYSEAETDESDISFNNNDWLNDNISSIYDKSHTIVEDNWSDEEVCTLGNTGDFQSARSLEEFGSNLTEKNKLLNKSKKDCIAKDETKTASQSCYQLVGHLKSPKKLLVGHKNTSEVKVLNPVKSKIPRKKNEQEKDFPVHVKGNNLSYVCQPFRKISKSSSLDSCLENINSKPVKQKICYNLVPGSSLPFNQLSPCKKKHYSDFSLLSSSFDKAGDSGYPYSFSSPNEDLTPEQVDELLSENELMSRSTSPSSEVDIINVVNQRLQPDIFIEDVLVENGDLANNNRDGEGNNVEGLIGQRLVNVVVGERDPNDNMFFPEVEEFPPWLLNLGELALRPVYFPLYDSDSDEGVVDKSSSNFNESIDLEDLDIDF